MIKTQSFCTEQQLLLHTVREQLRLTPPNRAGLALRSVLPAPAFRPRRRLPVSAEAGKAHLPPHQGPLPPSPRGGYAKRRAMAAAGPHQGAGSHQAASPDVQELRRSLDQQRAQLEMPDPWGVSPSALAAKQGTSDAAGGRAPPRHHRRHTRPQQHAGYAGAVPASAGWTQQAHASSPAARAQAAAAAAAAAAKQAEAAAAAARAAAADAAQEEEEQRQLKAAPSEWQAQLVEQRLQLLEARAQLCEREEVVQQLQKRLAAVEAAIADALEAKQQQQGELFELHMDLEERAAEVQRLQEEAAAAAQVQEAAAAAAAEDVALLEEVCRRGACGHAFDLGSVHTQHFHPARQSCVLLLLESCARAARHAELPLSRRLIALLFLPLPPAGAQGEARADRVPAGRPCGGFCSPVAGWSWWRR